MYVTVALRWDVQNANIPALKTDISGVIFSEQLIRDTSVITSSRKLALTIWRIDTQVVHCFEALNLFLKKCI